MKPELPDVRQAVLADTDVDALFRDVRSLCYIESVRRREAMDREESGTTLEEAREILRQSGQTAIQLRYRYDSRDWIDTLVREADGVHLTRIAQVDAPGS